MTNKIPKRKDPMQKKLTTLKPTNIKTQSSKSPVKKLNAFFVATLMTVSVICLPKAQALSISDTQIKESLVFDGHNLTLNGAGIRTKLFFKVYIGALYVSSKTNNADSIIGSTTPRVIELTFLRDIDGEKISSAFREGFSKNCMARCDELKVKVDDLAKAVPAIKQGQLLQIVATIEGVKLNLDGKSMADVKAQDLGKEMTRIFIGKNPPTEELKKGLLGG